MHEWVLGSENESPSNRHINLSVEFRQIILSRENITLRVSQTEVNASAI